METCPTPALPPCLIRVVLADDHDLVRSGLKLLLQGIAGVEVVSEASTGDELLAAIAHHLPDLAVTDISMPMLDGLGALARIREMPHPPRVLVVSMRDSPDLIRRAFKLGASGYVMKDASPVELEQAVRSVMAGQSYYGPQVSRKLLQAQERAPEEALTARQIEILLHIARGHATKEIGFKLGLSPKTVDVHRARIMERLGIDDVAGLTLYCVRQGLVQPDLDPRPEG